MNHQRVSEICFDEPYCVMSHETARSLFAQLPGGSAYAKSLIEGMATACLVAVAESTCIREMQRHIDAVEDVLVGRTVSIEHRAPIPAGTRLRLSGWVQRLSERSATFCVQVRDDHEVVSEVAITLVSVRRASIEARLSIKRGAPSEPRQYDSADAKRPVSHCDEPRGSKSS